MSEEQMQSQAFTWFWNKYPLLRRTLFAVPNGGGRDRIEASRMKGTGTVSGVSDLVWVLPEKVLFIEFKTEVGVQSDNQKDFERKVKAFKHEYILVRSVEQFKNIVEHYATRANIELKRLL